jgi:hypothetical protein
MNYRLSAHAAARLRERKVPIEWLQSVLDKPEQILVAAHGRQILQSIFIRDGKQWMLRVIVQDDLVITAMLTSKIEKYGGGL